MQTEATTVSVHKNSNRRLTKDSKIKNQIKFVDVNPLIRFTHFIQSRHLYEKYRFKSFLRFQVVARFLSFLLKRKSFPLLKKSWEELYPQEILAHHSLKKWTYNLISHIF